MDKFKNMDLRESSFNSGSVMKKVKILLITLLLLGICFNGYAQKETLSLPADPLTDEYYQAFRGVLL